MSKTTLTFFQDTKRGRRLAHHLEKELTNAGVSGVAVVREVGNSGREHLKVVFPSTETWKVKELLTNE